MSHLDILLPFSLPPAEMAADLLRTLKTPALATLLARSQTPVTQDFDAFSRALPHETWLARRFGLDTPHSSPALAAAAMQSFGLAPQAGHWFIVQPVHIHVARDHLVLTDRRRLDLREPEARALFETAKPLFEETGKTLLYGDADTWFMRADDWAGLLTSTTDAACGHNIDIWMPHDAHEIQDRAWRKLHNEVQMHWHTDPVNEQRAARSAEPVNSLWLWGGAAAGNTSTATSYTHAFNLPQTYGQLTAKQEQDCVAANAIGAEPQRGLLMLDALAESGLAQDWAYWLEQMQTLEKDWFVPLLAALRTTQVGSVSLILTHNTRLAEMTVTKNSLRKFWAAPSLAKLKT